MRKLLLTYLWVHLEKNSLGYKAHTLFMVLVLVWGEMYVWRDLQCTIWWVSANAHTCIIQTFNVQATAITLQSLQCSDNWKSVFYKIGWGVAHNDTILLVIVKQNFKTFPRNMEKYQDRTLTLEGFLRKHLIYSHNFRTIPKSYFYVTLQCKFFLQNALNNDICNLLENVLGIKDPFENLLKMTLITCIPHLPAIPPRKETEKRE